MPAAQPLELLPFGRTLDAAGEKTLTFSPSRGKVTKLIEAAYPLLTTSLQIHLYTAGPETQIYTNAAISCGPSVPGAAGFAARITKVINVDLKSPDERTRERKTLTRHSEERQFDLVASSFQELFTLLEEYAPIWYTEQHHKRALKARRALRQL